MKHPILTALLAALAFAGSAFAQQYAPASVYTQGTNAITANATVSPAAVITATKNNNVALQFTANSTAGATGNIVLSFAKSVDGVTYETTPSVTWTNAINGATPVAAVTNVSTGGVGYLKLNTIVSAVPAALTGVTVKAVKKPNN